MGNRSCLLAGSQIAFYLRKRQDDTASTARLRIRNHPLPHRLPQTINPPNVPFDT
jgi:hypothetical protein